MEWKRAYIVYTEIGQRAVVSAGKKPRAPHLTQWQWGWKLEVIRNGEGENKNKALEQL